MDPKINGRSYVITFAVFHVKNGTLYSAVYSAKERGRHGCLELGESEGSVRGLENVRLVCFHLDFIESQLVSNLCTVRCQVD